MRLLEVIHSRNNSEESVCSAIRPRRAAGGKGGRNAQRDLQAVIPLHTSSARATVCLQQLHANRPCTNLHGMKWWCAITCSVSCALRVARFVCLHHIVNFIVNISIQLFHRRSICLLKLWRYTQLPGQTLVCSYICTYRCQSSVT